MDKQSSYREIKAWMIMHGVKQKDLAKTLCHTQGTINRKLNRRGIDFTLGEVRKLSKVYGIPLKYFFTLDVPKMERREAEGVK